MLNDAWSEYLAVSNDGTQKRHRSPPPREAKILALSTISRLNTGCHRAFVPLGGTSPSRTTLVYRPPGFRPRLGGFVG